MQNVENAHRLSHQRAHLRKHWIVPIDLVEDLIAHRRPDNEAHVRKLFQFPLNSANTGTHVARDLADVKRFVCLSIEQRENSATGLPKQDIGQGIKVCSHLENNCILYENTLQETYETKIPDKPSNQAGGRSQ